jgi:CDP-diacylglycerol---glycerol-3-phosphate 3-phosphatidyltransferase
LRTADERAAAFLTGLTYLRVLLTPVVMALVLAGPGDAGAFALAAIVFAVAAATDYLDGRLARRWKQTSVFGTFLDTTADKLLVAGVLIALVQVGRASPWVAAIIIARELLMMGLRGAVTATDGTVVTPSFLGKAKASVQFTAIFLAILRPDVMVAGWFIDEWAMWIAATITIWSALDYLGRFFGRISRRTR